MNSAELIKRQQILEAMKIRGEARIHQFYEEIKIQKNDLLSVKGGLIELKKLIDILLNEEKPEK